MQAESLSPEVTDKELMGGGGGTEEAGSVGQPHLLAPLGLPWGEKSGFGV